MKEAVLMGKGTVAVLREELLASWLQTVQEGRRRASIEQVARSLQTEHHHILNKALN